MLSYYQSIECSTSYLHVSMRPDKLPLGQTQPSQQMNTLVLDMTNIIILAIMQRLEYSKRKKSDIQL